MNFLLSSKLRFVLILTASVFASYIFVDMIIPGDDMASGFSALLVWPIIILIMLGLFVFLDVYLWGHKSSLKLKNLKFWGMLFWLLLLALIFFKQSV